METEIKRVNFFDGQFLKEAEFQVEQLYHMHMRRRLNFMLFELPGVVTGLEPAGDDLEFDVIDPVLRTFRVKPGTAVALVSDPKEGKEIILRSPSAPVAFGGSIPPAAPGFVVIKQLEEASPNPPSQGSVPGDTRVEEKFEIQVHGAWPPVALPPDFEEYVFLGTLTFSGGTGTADYGNRQEAKLRGTLMGPSAPLTATVATITPNSGLDGTTFAATITGSQLQNASAVNFSDPAITANITGGNATTVNVDITIAGASAGPKTFLVVTPQGTADSTGVPGAGFSVTVPTPVVVTSTLPAASANLQAAAPPGTLQVRGTNIRNPALNNGDPAAGTVVRFVDSTNSSVVLATLPNPVVLSNAGATQRIQADLPLEGDLPGSFTLPGVVRVQVSFGGGTGDAPGTLNVF